MPIKIPDAAGKSYRPSNGTEGQLFEAQFCDRCCYEDERRGCPIAFAACWNDIGEDDYPNQWVFDAQGEPTCTAFSPKKEDRT